MEHAGPSPSPIYGRLAQLGERHVRNVEAEGSIPLPSTIYPYTSRVHCSVLRRCKGYANPITSLTIFIVSSATTAAFSEPFFARA